MQKQTSNVQGPKWPASLNLEPHTPRGPPNIISLGFLGHLPSPNLQNTFKLKYQIPKCPHFFANELTVDSPFHSEGKICIFSPKSRVRPLVKLYFCSVLDFIVKLKVCFTSVIISVVFLFC